MSLLELGGKYWEMYTRFKNIEVPCMVILMLSHNRFFTGNYHVMHCYILMFCGQFFCEDIILAIDC